MKIVKKHEGKCLTGAFFGASVGVLCLGWFGMVWAFVGCVGGLFVGYYGRELPQVRQTFQDRLRKKSTIKPPEALVWLYAHPLNRAFAGMMVLVYLVSFVMLFIMGSVVLRCSVLLFGNSLLDGGIWLVVFCFIVLGFSQLCAWGYVEQRYINWMVAEPHDAGYVLPHLTKELGGEISAKRVLDTRTYWSLYRAYTTHPLRWGSNVLWQAFWVPMKTVVQVLWIIVHGLAVLVFQVALMFVWLMIFFLMEGLTKGICRIQYLLTLAVSLGVVGLVLFVFQPVPTGWLLYVLALGSGGVAALVMQVVLWCLCALGAVGETCYDAIKCAIDWFGKRYKDYRVDIFCSNEKMA